MNFLNGSVRLGRFFGITVRVHVLFLIWIGFQLLNAGAEWRTQLYFSAMLFGIILVHEYGHCMGARAVGGFAEDILMWPLGGLAFAQAPMRPWPQFVTVACGPLVNVIFCMASAAALMISTQSIHAVSLNPFNWYGALLFEHGWQFYVADFYHLNLAILYFNLLPIYPMDGGQLFFTIIWPWLGIHRATEIACKVGIAGAILLGAYGLMGSSSRSSIQAASLIGIAIFGASTCWQRLQMAKHGMLMDDAFTTYDRVRRQRGQGAVVSWWKRLFPRKQRKDDGRVQNPNPGGWDAKLSQEEKLELEVDRILQKVHDRGIGSLSYIERQSLERATRMRREREEEIERRNRV